MPTEEPPAATNPPPAARLGLVTLVAGLLVAALGLLFLARQRPAELPVLAQLPSFQFTDQLGRPAGSETLRGRVWIAGFIFTRCPSVCPALTARMHEVLERLPRSEGSGPLMVSISVDPQHDTPQVLAAWAEREGVPAERWLALTGGLEPTRRLVREGFLLALDDTQRDDPGALLHDVRLVLVDESLRIRGYYDSTDPARLDQLVADAKRLARDGG